MLFVAPAGSLALDPVQREPSGDFRENCIAEQRMKPRCAIPRFGFASDFVGQPGEFRQSGLHRKVDGGCQPRVMHVPARTSSADVDGVQHPGSRNGEMIPMFRERLETYRREYSCAGDPASHAVSGRLFRVFLRASVDVSSASMRSSGSTSRPSVTRSSRSAFASASSAGHRAVPSRLAASSKSPRLRTSSFWYPAGRPRLNSSNAFAASSSNSELVTRMLRRGAPAGVSGRDTSPVTSCSNWERIDWKSFPVNRPPGLPFNW